MNAGSRRARLGQTRHDGPHTSCASESAAHEPLATGPDRKRIFLLVAGLCDLEYSSLGFPDCHLSEFDVETRNLRLATVWVNLAFGLFACVLGAI